MADSLVAVSAIRVRELGKRFGRTVALDGLTFEVEAGSVCGFLGPNGAGKTTALRILAGLVRADAGHADVSGRVGAALQGFGFHPQRSGRDHLRVLAARGGFPAARIDPVLDRVGMTARAGEPAGALSQGMRQRLGLAAALLGEPDVLLLDEPANGLDPHGLRWLRDLLREHAAAGGCALVSSHLLAELTQVADAVVLVHEGRLVATGRTEGDLRLHGPDPDRLLAALAAAGLPADRDGDAVRVGATLEDAYLALVSG